MARLDEVKRLQKIAGIIKENVDEARRGGDIGDKVAQIISQLEPQEDEYQNWVDNNDEMATNTKMYMFTKTAKIPGYRAVVVGDTSDGQQAYWLLTKNMESDDPYGYPSGILGGGAEPEKKKYPIANIYNAIKAAFPDAVERNVDDEDYAFTVEGTEDKLVMTFALKNGGDVVVVDTPEGELMYKHFNADGDLLAYDGGLQGQYEEYTGKVAGKKLAPIVYKAAVKPKGEVNIIDVIKSKFPQFPIDDYEVFKSEYEISAGEFDSEIGLDNIRALNSAADKGYIKAFDDVVKINSMFYSKEQQERYRAKYK